MRLGTGTTEPTLDDYCLETDIMSSLSNVNVTVNSSYESGKTVTVLTISGTNNTGDSIGINEIGIAKNVNGQAEGTVSTGKEPILFIRSLLEAPKVVGAGSSFSLTFEWVES